MDIKALADEYKAIFPAGDITDIAAEGAIGNMIKMAKEGETPMTAGGTAEAVLAIFAKIKEETPSEVVEPEVVEPEVVAEEAAPVVEEEATPVVEEEATPVVEEEATPVVEEEATPVVEEEVKS